MKLILKILNRIGNRNKLCYFMTIAFGISLLMITLQFQFGKTIIETPEAIIEMDSGYITEQNQIVRVVEGILSLGLISLGVERIVNERRRKSGINSVRKDI